MHNLAGVVGNLEFEGLVTETLLRGTSRFAWDENLLGIVPA